MTTIDLKIGQHSIITVTALNSSLTVIPSAGISWDTPTPDVITINPGPGMIPSHQCKVGAKNIGVGVVRVFINGIYKGSATINVSKDEINSVVLEFGPAS